MRRLPKFSRQRQGLLLLSLCVWLASVMAQVNDVYTTNENGGDICSEVGEDVIKSIDNEMEDHLYLHPQCGTTHSQTSLALKMAQTSSPKGSPSHAKLKHLLNHHKYFSIDLEGDQHLFDVVTDNVGTALQGYGLQLVASMETPHEDNEGIVQVETLFSQSHKDSNGVFYMDLPNRSVIIIQTEQICCSHYGTYALPYLLKCHSSPNCIVWEYSYLNYQWLVDKGLGDSVVLLPTLHQHRLDPYYAKQSSEEERPIDVVFFGIMTSRRQQIRTQLERIASEQGWNIVLEQVEHSGSRLDYMATQYQHSKLCLIVHSFSDKSPGEYHRLSEMAPSGCLPVVESFGDELGIEEYYHQCGGVVFSNLSNIPSVIHSLLTLSYESASKRKGRVAWWEKKVDWWHLLKIIILD